MGNDVILVGLFGFIALYIVVKVRMRTRRMRLAAEIARAGTSPLSLVGRVVVTALGIVGVQWLVMTHSDNQTLKWVVLAVPALVSAVAVVRTLTVTGIEPRRRNGGR